MHACVLLMHACSRSSQLIQHTRSHPFPASLREPIVGLLKHLEPHTSHPLLRLLARHCDVW